MATSLASATIERDGTSTDIVVPTGTTVAHVLSLMQIDTSAGDVRVTTTDGRGADPAATLGLDIPSGAVLSVSGMRASARAHRESARTQRDLWFPRVLALSTASVFTALAVVLLVAPFAMGGGVILIGAVPWARPVLAVLGALGVGAAAIRQEIVTRPLGAILVTGAAGVLPLAWVSPGDPLMVVLVPAIVTWTAACVSLLVWIVTRHPVPATAAAAWSAVALVVSAMAAWDVPMGRVAPVLLAVAVLACVVVPDRSMRVPDAQLLDIPTVLTSAPAVRSFGVVHAKRVTNSRVLTTILRAEGISETLIIACSLAAIVISPAAARSVTTHGWQGWAALALMVFSTIALALLPRSSQSHVSRIYPRVAATAILVVTTTSPGVLSTWGINGSIAAAMVLALLFVGGAIVVNREPHPVVLARMGEILHGFSLAVLLPASVAAAGLFDLIRQVAS